MAGFPTPIPEDALDLTPLPAEFAQSFADIVGNAGTDSDGFLALLDDAANLLRDVPDILVALDGHTADIAGAATDAAAPWESNFSGALADTITGGQPDFDQFAFDLTGNTPPTPGGPGPSTYACDTHLPVVEFGKVPAGGQLTEQGNIYRNTGNVPVTITNVTLDQGTPKVFVLGLGSGPTAALPATLQPGEAAEFAVSADSLASGQQAAFGDYYATVTLTFRAGPQVKVCLHCTLVSTPIGTGGGGGGDGDHGGPHHL